MALKDAIDKIVSYFDTDEVTDYEDAAKEEAKERPVKSTSSKSTEICADTTSSSATST